MRGLARQLAELWEVPRDLLLGRYPPFVTGGPLPQGHVPVFVFHGLEPLSFERKLRHLKDNGYESLAAEEYLDVLTGARAAPPRAVVLSFDDGRGSLWSVGYPLLRRYGMRGIVFLVPARVADHPATLPTWDDVREGKAPTQQVLSRDDGPQPFLSWAEVEALARSEVYDFQSHTLSHARIHTAPRLERFLSPRDLRGYQAMDVPLIHRDGRDLLAHEAALGTPLLTAEARTSEALRFFEEPSVREALVERVADAGGERFFERRGWEAQLRGLLAHRAISGRLETPQEREAAIQRELGEARTVIEERTGRAVVHLCYPWHVAGPTARRLAPELGYRMAFCGKVRGTPISLPGNDPHTIARIGEDYVELLPGRGRGRLASVLTRKWRRRMSASREP